MQCRWLSTEKFSKPSVLFKKILGDFFRTFSFWFLSSYAQTVVRWWNVKFGGVQKAFKNVQKIPPKNAKNEKRVETWTTIFSHKSANFKKAL